MEPLQLREGPTPIALLDEMRDGGQAAFVGDHAVTLRVSERGTTTRFCSTPKRRMPATSRPSPRGMGRRRVASEVEAIRVMDRMRDPGQPISVRSVREALGGGSSRTVAEYVRT